MNGGCCLDRVYVVTGEDSADDPAYGFDPIKTGTPVQVASWLLLQPSVEQLSVVRESGGSVWACDYLAAAVA